jgi:adenylylsulfate kinase
MHANFSEPIKPAFLFSDNSSVQSNVLVKPFVVWLTGLSGSGKTTLANECSRLLKLYQISVVVLDGDVVRKGLCNDLGYSQSDRDENIRRIAEVAKILLQAGIVVIVASIAPLETERALAAQIIGKDAFIEVYVNATIETCMQRDPKGLYKKALAGEIKNFTGIDAPYDIPKQPATQINTEQVSVNDAGLMLIQFLEKNKWIKNGFIA